MLVLVRSVYLTALFIALVWPRYMFFDIAGRGISPYVLTMLVLIGATCAAVIIARQRMSGLLIGAGGSLWVMMALIAYAGIRIFADIMGISPATSLGLTMQFAFFQMAWVLAGMVCLLDPVARVRFPIILILGGLVATMAGMVEYLTQQPFASITGLQRIIADRGNVITAINSASSDDASFRIKGLFTHPIIYGQVMALLIPVGIHVVRFYGGVTKILGFLCILGAVFGMYVCQSRSPIFVLVATMIVYVFLNLFDIRNVMRMALFSASIFTGVIASTLLFDAAYDSVVGSDAREIKSTQVRQTQFARAASAMQLRPLFGYGSGLSPVYAGVEGRNNVITVDSRVIVEEVDGGYVRLTAYAIMIILAFFSGALLTNHDPVLERRSIHAAMSSWILGVPVGLLIITSDDMMSFFYIGIGFIVSGRAVRIIEGRAQAAAVDDPDRRQIMELGAFRQRNRAG